MRLCVTGATGRIGETFLAFALCQPELRLRVLYRRGEPPLQDRADQVEWVQGDLIDPTVCDRLVRNQDVLVHLAWNGVPLAGVEFAAGLVDGLLPTLNLLDAAKRHGKLGIVFPSSGGTVYADSGSRRSHSENDPCVPSSPYGIQKLATEQYLRVLCAAGSVWSRVLRISNAYGWIAAPGAQQGFIGIALASAMRGEPVRLVGNPENVRDFVHRDDVARSLLLAATHPLRPGMIEVLNIGSGIGTSVSDVLTLIESELGRPVSVRQEYWDEARGLPGHSVLDINRAAAVLGWEPRIGLREGIRKSVGLSNRSASLPSNR